MSLLRRACAFVYRAVFVLSTSLWASSMVHAADARPPVVFLGAKILTGTGEVHDPGVLMIADGKIIAVGPASRTNIPLDAVVHDVKDKVIIPGLVDTHSHLGVYPRPAVSSNRDGNEMSGPVQGIVRALDSLNPFDPGIRMANAGGVTAANIMPGSGNVIGGQTLYVKLRGHSPEQMWIAARDVLGGLKMANGENPKRAYGGKGQAPGTRMKVAALQRAAFLDAQDYRQKWADYREKKEAGKDVSPPDVDFALQPLVEVLEGRRTVHFHTHRADDILTVLRLKREFEFDLLIQHGTESYKVLDEIAAAGVPVSMTIIDSPGGKAEVVDFTEQCGAEMARKGIKVLINTDDPITESRFLLRTAATAVRGGLSEELALKAVTLHPAQVLRLDDRIGSLEQGKDADFAVLSGEPFSVYTRVLATYIDGEKVFDVGDEKLRLYQTGGFAVADRAMVPADGPAAQPLPVANVPEGVPGHPNATGDSNTILILAGRLHTVANGTIENAAIVVRDGKFAEVGRRNEIAVPDGIPVLTAAVVTPGLIDAHSVVPLAGEYAIPADSDEDEISDPNQADVRTLDGFNPREPLLRYLLEQGVTVVHACPGRANVIAGSTGVFRTSGASAEAMAIRFPQAMLFNLGVDPKETYEGKRPTTRMGTAALVRQALADAANYAGKVREFKEKKEKNAGDEKDDDDKDDATPPKPDLKSEALARVLSKQVPAVFCAQQADDILTALRIIREFKLNGQIALAAEGYLCADDLQQAGVPVIVHPTMQRVGSLETYNSFLGNAAAMAGKGVPLAIGSGVEDYVPKTRVVRYEAAMAMVYGLGFDRALRAVTLDAAKILGIDDRFGSVEVGKAADLVLYDGDPFEHVTHTTHVLVDGKLVFDRSQRPPISVAERAWISTPELPCCLGW